MNWFKREAQKMLQTKKIGEDLTNLLRAIVPGQWRFISNNVAYYLSPGENVGHLQAELKDTYTYSIMIMWKIRDPEGYVPDKQVPLLPVQEYNSQVGNQYLTFDVYIENKSRRASMPSDKLPPTQWAHQLAKMPQSLWNNRGLHTPLEVGQWIKHIIETDA